MTDTKVREIDPQKPIFKKDRRRGWAYGLAAALVVLLLGSVVWAVFLNDGEEVAPQPAPTPTTVPVEAVVGPNLLEVAASTGQYNTFLELVQISGYDEILSQAGTFTVFAPTDDAFAALPSDLLESLKANANPAFLEEILDWSTTTIQLDSSQLTNVANAGGLITMTSGDPLPVSVDVDGTLLVARGSDPNYLTPIIQPDLRASNGILHGIDTVNFPLSMNTFNAPTS